MTSFSLGDLSSDESWAKAIGNFQQNPKGSLSTSASHRPARLALTTYDISSVMQGASTYRGKGFNADLFNQALSPEFEGLRAETQPDFAFQEDRRLSPYDVAVGVANKTTMNGGLGTVTPSGQAFDVGGITSGEIPGGDVPEKIWRYLRGKGLSATAVAGIMGNIQAESGFKIDINEYSGGGGYGLVQWTGGRRTALMDFAASNGLDATQLTTQLDFLWYELTTGYKSSTLDPLSVTVDLWEAVGIFLNNFEKPAERTNNWKLRHGFAIAIMERFKGI